MSVPSLLKQVEGHLFTALEAVERIQTVPTSDQSDHLITARQQIDNAKAVLLDAWTLRNEEVTRKRNQCIES